MNILYRSLVLVVLFVCSYSYGQESTIDQSYGSSSATLDAVFPKFNLAMDSITSQLFTASREISSNVQNLLIYKLKIKWLLRSELKASELQFLNSYFENRLRIALAKDRRFVVYSGHDLRTLFVKATDSTLQVKNTYSEEQLRTYAKTHNIHAIVSPEFLVTEDEIFCYLNVNDLNSINIWNREFRGKLYLYAPPSIKDVLREEHDLKKLTGLPQGHFTSSFISIKAFNGDTALSSSRQAFLAVGYKFNDVATIFSNMNFFIDTKIVYGPNFGGIGWTLTPGFGFELYGDGEIGRKIILLNVAGGYYIESNVFTTAITAGASVKLSRLLGISFEYLNFGNPGKAGNIYPAGNGYIGQIYFVL
ncbi:MAG: hypothetical protein WCX28_01770 [Bacteriovoracaceae bacterium]|nr:hypothetical protein [Bacteroidota bacterium]